MKLCRNCNKKFSNEFKFCTDCGTYLKKDDKLFKRVLIILLILTAIIFFIKYLESNISDFNTARQDLQDYKNEKIINEYLSKYDIQIESDWKYTIKGDYIYINGSVKNVGNKDVNYFEIGAEFIDSNNNIIDTDWTNNSGKLKPNSSKKFEIMHKNDGKIENVKLEVLEVR